MGYEVSACLMSAERRGGKGGDLAPFVCCPRDIRSGRERERGGTTQKRSPHENSFPAGLLHLCVLFGIGSDSWLFAHPPPIMP